MHRTEPILLGSLPAAPPCDDTFYRDHYRSAAVSHQLEGAGVPGVQGVWAHQAGGGRFWLTVSIKQMYPGHAKQAGLIASQCHAGAYAVVATSRMRVGPAGIDKGVADILVSAIVKAEADPEFVAAMKKGEYDIAAAKSEENKARIKAAVQEFNVVKDMVKSYVK